MTNPDINRLPTISETTVTPVAATPRFWADPQDKWVIDGVEYAPRSSDQFGHVLRRLDNPDLCEAFSHADIEAFRQAERLIVTRGYFRPTKALQRLASTRSRISDLPREKQEKVLWRKDICDNFMRAETRHEASRSDKSIKSVINRIVADTLAARFADGRCGSEDIKLRHPPSPRALRRWLGKYEASGYDPMVLADGYDRSGNTTPQLKSDERQLVNRFAETFASRLKPSKAKILRDLKAEIEALNNIRKAEGKPLLAQVGRGALNAAIDKLDPFRVEAGREGIEAAKRKFYIVNGGLDVTRPLERVELDEWKIQLQTILMDMDLWGSLLPEEQAQLERKRFWLSTAIDTRTRCCLAARIVETCTATSSVATLQMAVNDKRYFVDAAGCMTAWDMFGTPETVSTDNGSSYASHEFRSAVIDLEAEILFPPAGKPQMRGRQERFFRTLHTQFAANFEGRTFENVVVKGDYNSEKRAVLDIAELGHLIVRYIVDIYHNTPHAGLGGETPRACWLRLVQEHPVIPPPGAARNRHIFGTTLERRITNSGVKILGIAYQSRSLQELRRTRKQKPVLVRVDNEDLGQVSVRTDEGWLTVPAARPGFNGVALNHWLDTAASLRRRHVDTARLAEPVVMQALRDIEEFSRTASQHAGIASPILSSTDFDRFERDVFRGFDFVRGPEDGPQVIEGFEAEENQDPLFPIEEEVDPETVTEDEIISDAAKGHDWFME